MVMYGVKVWRFTPLHTGLGRSFTLVVSHNAMGFKYLLLKMVAKDKIHFYNTFWPSFEFFGEVIVKIRALTLWICIHFKQLPLFDLIKT